MNQALFQKGIQAVFSVDTNGPVKVKVGWINPAYVFDEERLTGLVRSAGKLNDVGVERSVLVAHTSRKYKS